VIFGDQDAQYDADHDTSVKRSDNTAGPELHHTVVTDDGTPAYLGTGETLLLRVYCDGDAGGAAVVSLTNAILVFSHTWNDLA